MFNQGEEAHRCYDKAVFFVVSTHRSAVANKKTSGNCNSIQFQSLTRKAVTTLNMNVFGALPEVQIQHDLSFILFCVSLYTNQLQSL